MPKLYEHGNPIHVSDGELAILTEVFFYGFSQFQADYKILPFITSFSIHYT